MDLFAICLALSAYVALMYLMQLPAGDRIVVIRSALPARYSEKWRASVEAETAQPACFSYDIYQLVQAAHRMPDRLADRMSHLVVRGEGLYEDDKLVLPASCARYVLHRAILTAYCDTANVAQRLPSTPPAFNTVVALLSTAGCAIGGVWGLPHELIKACLRTSLSGILLGAYAAQKELVQADMSLLKTLDLHAFRPLQPSIEEQRRCFSEGGA